MENSHMSVQERLKWLIQLKSMTIQQFSEEIKFPKGTLEKYLNSDRLPNAEFLSALHSHMGVSAHWVLDGVEPMYLIDAGELEAAGAIPIDFGKNDTKDGQVFHTKTLAPDSFVPIPRYQVEASAGLGTLALDEAETGFYAFNQSWLDRRNLKPASLAVISVRGDSMDPTLSEGDLILVDRDQTKIADGVTYVLRVEDDLLVKYLQHVTPSVISLVSANTRYPPRDVDIEALGDQIEIIGRVVASMHEW